MLDHINSVNRIAKPFVATDKMSQGKAFLPTKRRNKLTICRNKPTKCRAEPTICRNDFLWKMLPKGLYKPFFQGRKKMKIKTST